MSGKNARRTAEAFALLALLIFSFLLLFVLGVLSWPIGQSIGSSQSSNPQSGEQKPVVPGVLIINLTGEEQSVPSATVSDGSIMVEPYAFSYPIGGVTIRITKTGVSTPVALGSTNGSGLLVVPLAPAYYQVTVLDTRFNNLTVNLQVSQAQRTHFSALFNETHYPTTSYNLFDSDSSGWIGSWNEVFVQIATNQSIRVGISTREFLQVNMSTAGNVSESLNSLIPASILSSSLGNNSQWVQLRVSRFMSVSGIGAITVVTYDVKYTVTISAV